MTSLAVLTRDLRINDNPVLGAAHDGLLVPLFVSDPDVERIHASPNRQAYLAESLVDLDGSLAALGGGLVHRRGPWVDTVIATASDVGASSIHVAADVSGYATRRLTDLETRSTVPVVVHESVTVVPPNRLHSAGGTGYRVFTPYFRRWIAEPRRPRTPVPARIGAVSIDQDPLPSPDQRRTSTRRLRGGERIARKRMDEWLPTAISYRETRDHPGADATSHLSAALHLGVVSPLELSDRAMALGANEFVRQIAWRDFNHQLLFHHPEASQRNLRGHPRVWRNDPEELAAWQRGATGYPLVDAAMRQLVATGWIHNRARMVTASFLTKDLMIDWRIGARWFMRWLVDGDVANNQLGWQWVAGTGSDSNPRRIFNPTRQSERFDPSGVYIRRWVPELADVDPGEIHDPGPLTRITTGYPEAIVDHREAVDAFVESLAIPGS